MFVSVCQILIYVVATIMRSTNFFIHMRKAAAVQSTLSRHGAGIRTVRAPYTFMGRSMHGSPSPRQQGEQRRQPSSVPKSPFQTFVEVLREEIQKDQELQAGMKQLQGSAVKIQDLESLRRAREAYERARVSADPVLAWSLPFLTLLCRLHRASKKIRGSGQLLTSFVDLAGN